MISVSDGPAPAPAPETRTRKEIAADKLKALIEEFPEITGEAREFLVLAQVALEDPIPMDHQPEGAD